MNTDLVKENNLRSSAKSADKELKPVSGCLEEASGLIYSLINTNWETINMRLLHTMIRVGDLQRSIEFYTKILGMELLHKKDYPEGKFTLAFLGYGKESNSTVIELTHNWDTDSYDLGNGFGHIAIEVGDVYKATEEIRNKGGKIVRDAGPMNAGTTVIAFVADPDGYEIELIGSNGNK